MAWLPVTFWCRRCWWKKTFEWYCTDVLVDRPGLILQVFSLSKRRKGYSEHRKEKPNCKQRKLFFHIQPPTK